MLKSIADFFEARNFNRMDISTKGIADWKRFSSYQVVFLGFVLGGFFSSQALAQKTGFDTKFRYKESVAVNGSAEPPAEELSLWYPRPASIWEEALPLGNGRLGAMVYGGIAKEMIQLNEESIWAGPPVPEVKNNVREKVGQVRSLLFDKKYKEAQQLQQSIMAPRISPRSYQTMGELIFDFDLQGEARDYRRDLNLDTAVATTQYSIDGTRFKREVFISPVDQVVMIHLTADQPGKISFKARVHRVGDFNVAASENETLIATGQATHGKRKHLGVKFSTVYRAVADNGEVTIEDAQLKVDAADKVTICIAAATDYNRDDTAKPLQKNLAGESQAIVAAALAKGFQKVKQDSIASHQELFRRVDLMLGEASAKNTEQRLQAYKADAAISDPNFEALYFQYGRYLLIASSREGVCRPICRAFGARTWQLLGTPIITSTSTLK